MTAPRDESGGVSSAMAALLPIYLAAAAVPVAWSASDRGFGGAFLAVAAAAFLVVALQLTSVALLARRGERTSKARDRFMPRVCLAIALAPLAAVLLAAAFQTPRTTHWAALVEASIAGLAAELLAAWAARRAIAAPAGHPRPPATSLFLAATAVSAVTVLGLGLRAHRAVLAEARSRAAADHLAIAATVADAVRASNGAGSEIEIETLVDALTRFDEARVFAVDPRGDWRHRFDRAQVDEIETAIAAHNRKAAHHGFGARTVALAEISDAKTIVGVRLPGEGEPVLVYTAISLLFVALLAAAVLSMRFASRVRATAAIDSINEAEGRGPTAGQDTREKRARVFVSMSHDIRSPLNSVIGFTDLLLRGMDGELSKPQRDTVSRIAQHSERLMVLISDILDTAKLDSGSFELDRSWAPSVEILTACAQGARRLVASKSVEFEAALEPGLPPVWVDKERLGRALLSVIARMVDSMEKGTVELRASRGRRIGEGERVLVVRIANATGDMDARIAQRMAAAFSRKEGDAAGEPGTELGLGLALARRIISLHDGDVAVERPGGAGFALMVTLPLEGPP